MRIGIDFDDVLNTFLPSTIAEINLRYDKDYILEDIKGWNMLEYIDITEEQLFAIWTPEFIESIPLKDGVREMIDELKSDGHRVVVVTACFTPTHEHREQACVEQLGLEKNDVIFIKDKYMLDIDVLIDDRLDNFLDDYELPCKFEKIVMDMPHNKKSHKIGWHYRAKSLDDILESVKLIEKNKK